MSGTELQPREARPIPVMDDEEIRRTFRVADALAKSGHFKDAKQATQAFSKILAGRDLGLSPFEAMSALHVIEGKIEASADLQASRVKASAKYDYRVVVLDNEQCELEFFQDGETIGHSVFTMDDARQAKLDAKDVWKKYPRSMLFARAMSNGVAWFCPDVMGGLRVYSPGELAEVRPDVTAGEGEYVEPEDIPAKVAEWAPHPTTGIAIIKLIDRARRLGHAGFSDYGSIELALKGQREALILDWLERSGKQLDALEARQEAEPPEAEVVPDSVLEMEEQMSNPDQMSMG